MFSGEFCKIYKNTFYTKAAIFRSSDRKCPHPQKQPQKLFYKERVLKNFAKFTGNTCARTSF